GVKERLLLDRIDLQRGDISARNLEHAVFVVTDFADAAESVENLAAMPARIAAHGFVFQRIDELRRGLCRSLCQDLAERDLLFSQLGHSPLKTLGAAPVLRSRRMRERREG